MSSGASHQSTPTPRPAATAVRFVPFRSIAEPSFWLDHNSNKLNVLRLSEDGVPLHGFFGVAPPSAAGGGTVTGVLPPGMRFDSSSSSASFENDGVAATVRRNEWVRSSGQITSLNTLESFKKLNKNSYLNETCLPTLLKCCGVLSPSENDDNILDPNVALLASTCLTYCNLKTNMTVYWFAFPALAPRSGCGITYTSKRGGDSDSSGGAALEDYDDIALPPQRRLLDAWGTKACRMLSTSFHNFRVSQEEINCSDNGNSSVWCPPFFLLLSSLDQKSMKCLPLSKSTYDNLTDEEKERVIFGFVDPNVTTPSSSSNSDADELDAVGWTLRNLVAYLSLCLGLGGHDRTFLSYRSPFLRRITLSEEGKTEIGDCVGDLQESFEDVGTDDYEDDNCNDAGIGQSLLLDIRIPLASDYKWPASAGETTAANGAIISSYRCVGWELNKNNKPGPRSIDLRPLVSPAHLSRQANDLNLRLMKWRALPSLDVEKLSQMKVLLLGAGTLGCSVARMLLGWGIRNITFADSGRVSYSNPVRQNLFCVEDCKDGGRHKAVAAAESLKAIAGPDVKSEGIVLTIQMPGHSFGASNETEAVRRDVERLHSLIDESDAVFLLTDTRESRWLPTVMALATQTPLINAALGLDSWLVMRHGPPSSALSALSSTGDKPQRLGCYFCSDVVAPENSTRDRTLDQQCTVTRPGLAPIAASMATELMVAMFHHPSGHCAPAPQLKRGEGGNGAYTPADDGTDASSSALGRLPHQVRGTVVTYTMMTPTVPAFPSCTACSDSVVEEYRRKGFEFVKCVCCDEDGMYLEKVSGLATFREEAARKIDECLDWDDEDEDE